MATPELRELRHQYKAAYTSYMHCVQALSEASQNGVWPPREILAAEEEAMGRLTFMRQALLDALFEHAKKPGGAGHDSQRALGAGER